MDCRLVQPGALEEALAVRQRYGQDAMPIAGGQSLLVMLRNKLIAPELLIDLEPLRELHGIEHKSGGLSIGAMTTFYALLSSPAVERAAAVLARAAAKVSSTAIRNLGTIGGNLCHNELGADLPPVLLALNSVAELKSREGTRKVPLGDFFRGYFETALKPEELLCRIEIAELPQGAGGVYLKHAITSEDLAMVGVAAVVVPDPKRNGAVAEVRIGLGGVAPVPLRAVKAEAALKGAVLDGKSAHAAAEIAATEADPGTDPHASAEYRRKMVKIFVRRALVAALEQAGRNGHGEV